MKAKATHADFYDHASPIKRLDGQSPFNDYLWPLETDAWNLGHDDRHRNQFSGRWALDIVALNDGRYATTGCVYYIKKNSDPCWFDLPCVFPDRPKALRVAAGRLIRQLRWSGKWNCAWDSVKGKKLEIAVNWVLDIIARENKTRHRRVTVNDPAPPSPPPPPVKPIIPAPVKNSVWDQL